jgi:hypothetical protein
LDPHFIAYTRAATRKTAKTGVSGGKTETSWLDLRHMNDNAFPTRKGGGVRLSTSSCKKVPYRSSDFEVPTGFKTVMDSKEVLISGAEKKEIEELLDSIGFASDPGHKQPQRKSK